MKLTSSMGVNYEECKDRAVMAVSLLFPGLLAPSLCL